MADQLKAIRGMHDLIPAQTGIWHFVEDTVRDVLESYGYGEIRFPIVEKTALFKRGIGEVTDIVEKEMYTFEDRNGDSLSLRPEGTACCVRASLEHGLLHNQIQRLWYRGPMFRHERPQKGRYRQFNQIGVEAFGMSGPDIDAELILQSHRLWQRLGLQDAVSLQLNSLGSSECRHRYRDALVEYLSGFKADLDEDSQRRLETNPLRILDSKAPQTQEIVKDAPRLADFLSEESRSHFTRLCAYLDQAGIKYEVNSALVRGLDYYSMTVFEWVTDRLGAQGTVCAGGRFDNLIPLLGGKPTPAIGMAMGLERIITLVEELQVDVPVRDVDAYVVLVGDSAQQQGLVMVEAWRSQNSDLRIVTNSGGGSFKSQMKRADKSGARYAIILAEDEIAESKVSLKSLRANVEQVQLNVQDVVEHLIGN